MQVAGADVGGDPPVGGEDIVIESVAGRGFWAEIRKIGE